MKNTLLIIAVASIAFLISRQIPEAEEYPEITIWESDRMLDSVPVDLDSIFHAEFPREKWAFDLLAERYHLDKSSIFWSATARAIADAGETWAIVEYHEEGDTPQEATQFLIEELRKGSDTLRIRQSITND